MFIDISRYLEIIYRSIFPRKTWLFPTWEFPQLQRHQGVARKLQPQLPRQHRDGPGLWLHQPRAGDAGDAGDARVNMWGVHWMHVMTEWTEFLAK